VRARQGSSLLSSTPYYHLVPVLPEKGWGTGLVRLDASSSRATRSHFAPFRRTSGSQWETLVSYELGPPTEEASPIGTIQHQICLVRPFLRRKAIFFWVLWAPYTTH